jgi:hypothetical protein
MTGIGTSAQIGQASPLPQTGDALTVISVSTVFHWIGLQENLEEPPYI